jgi:hypothetical protein
VFIPAKIAADVVNEATGEKRSRNKASAYLKALSFDFGFNVPGNKAKAPRRRPRFQSAAQRTTAKLYVGKSKRK